MKIVRIEAHPIRVPRLTRFLPRTAHGESTSSEYVVLRVFTDDGIDGLGEVTCSPGWNGEEATGTRSLIESHVEDALLEVDPFNWNLAASRIDRIFRDRPFLRAGLEMALLDVVGKALSVRVVDLLGGPVREIIPTKIVLPGRDTETVRGMAHDLGQYELEAVKVKVGFGVDEDVARVAAVRDALSPDVSLTVDANEGWTFSDAGRAIAALEDLGVSAVEQPLKRSAWKSCAQLRLRHHVNFVADESLWTLQDLLRCHLSGAFDTVSLYPGKCGGLRRTIQLAETAESLGLEVTYGSNLELGIGAAALAHTIACTPSLSDVVPADLIGPLYFESSVVLDAEFVGWGRAEVPHKPGLGVSLDEDALQKYRIS